MALVAQTPPSFSPRCAPLRAELLCQDAPADSSELMLHDADAGTFVTVENVLHGAPNAQFQAHDERPLVAITFQDPKTALDPGAHLFATHAHSADGQTATFRTALPIRDDGTVIDPRDSQCSGPPAIDAHALAEIVGTRTNDECRQSLQHLDARFTEDRCEGRRGLWNVPYCRPDGTANPDVEPSFFCSCEHAELPMGSLSLFYLVQLLKRRRRVGERR
ncbi:MAG: hypothetical protein ACJ790_01100 [Myxococcaceae bacterium]